MDKSEGPVLLIVEDEQEVLVSVAMGIADAGSIVHQARDADEARRLLWDRSEIEVLFTEGGAGGYEWPGTRAFRQAALHGSQDHRHIWPVGNRNVLTEDRPENRGIFDEGSKLSWK